MLDIRVPEIVETDMPQAGLLEKPAKYGGQRFRVEEFPHSVHKNITFILLILVKMYLLGKDWFCFE